MTFRKGELDMEMVKIRIPNKAQSAKAFQTLMSRGRVDCYRGDVYNVPEAALDILRKIGIHYQELERTETDSGIRPDKGSFLFTN
jgi:hypothetical protein